MADEIDTLREVMIKVKQQCLIKLDAMMVLPDHSHAMWTLPADDNDYSTRWGLIKSGFPRKMPKIERINKGERGSR